MHYPYYGKKSDDNRNSEFQMISRMPKCRADNVNLHIILHIMELYDFYEEKILVCK